MLDKDMLTEENVQKLMENQLTITVFNGGEGAPLVLMHEDHNEGEAVRKLLLESNISCTLACISGMTWEHDLAPWDAPASFKKGRPFTGGADEHIRVIVDRIVPKLEENAGHGFSEKYIAGYSLAGLFAMYSVYHTDLFDGFASASGSMWFPGFTEYAKSHVISKQVKRAYFSIGNKESKTRNPLMQPVEENTRCLEHCLSEQGIETVFELNEGGHFVEDDLRLARGIAWLLKPQKV